MCCALGDTACLPCHSVTYEAGLTDQDREWATQRRHLNPVTKMNKNSQRDSVGTTTSVEELQAIRTAQGIGSPSQRSLAVLCTIYYECRRSDSAKHVDQMLGTGVISFPELYTMLGM